jgi:hypothetical protein
MMMYTIKYLRKSGTKFMRVTAGQLASLMKYSVLPDGGKIFGDAWLVSIHREEFFE